jgi:hypothetical protein
MEPITFRTLVLLLFAFSFSISSVHGQTTTVRAAFVHDSTRVGDEFPFYLTATYPLKEQVLFPDSSFDFSPLEFRRKEYFRTRSTNTTSYDSVVYYLSSFETDRVQQFSLPVFLLTEKDCTLFMSNRDSFLMQQLVTQIPDSLRSIPVRASIMYQQADRDFNIPLVIIGFGIVVILGSLLWILFGEKLRRNIRIRKLRKAHLAFISAFDSNVKSGNTFSARETEAALIVWKRYMEQLSPWPYTRLTTPETLRIEKDDALGMSLRAIDAAIYGSASPEYQSLLALKSFADARFNKRIQEVKNG